MYTYSDICYTSINLLLQKVYNSEMISIPITPKHQQLARIPAVTRPVVGQGSTMRWEPPTIT